MGAKRYIIFIVNRDTFRKSYQHRAVWFDLAHTQEQTQIAGPGHKDAAEHRSVIKHGWKGDHAFVVDGGHAKLVERTAARGRIAFGDELSQLAVAIEIKRLQSLASAPHRRHECDLIPIVDSRGIEFQECPGRNTWRIGAAESDNLK